MYGNTQEMHRKSQLPDLPATHCRTTLEKQNVWKYIGPLRERESASESERASESESESESKSGSEIESESDSESERKNESERE